MYRVKYLPKFSSLAKILTLHCGWRILYVSGSDFGVILDRIIYISTISYPQSCMAWMSIIFLHFLSVWLEYFVFSLQQWSYLMNFSYWFLSLQLFCTLKVIIVVKKCCYLSCSSSMQFISYSIFLSLFALFFIFVIIIYMYTYIIKYISIYIYIQRIYIFNHC